MIENENSINSRSKSIEPGHEVFTKENMKRVNSYFRKKQFLVILTCILILLFSQWGFQISSKLLTSQDSQLVKQVTHLTTAIFLLLMGSFIEYSSRTDLYVFLVTLITFAGKMENGHTLFINTLADG